MEKKLTIQLEKQLLQARQDALKEMHESSLRSHGKLLGMDVFSWYNPNTQLLINTLHSFPFNIIWVGNEMDIKKVIAEDNAVSANIHSIIAYDNPAFLMDIRFGTNVENVVGTSQLYQALDLMVGFKANDAIVLFTSSGPNWKENKEIFEHFVKTITHK